MSRSILATPGYCNCVQLEVFPQLNPRYVLWRMAEYWMYSGVLSIITVDRVILDSMQNNKQSYSLGYAYIPWGCL